jgi:hypothetical protein
MPVDLDASLRSPCLAHTRKDILNEIINWFIAPQADSNILWLSGVAGSGKSTIAASIAKHFRDHGALGAFVFFSRNTDSSPRAVLHGIAHELAMLNRDFKTTLCRTLDRNPGIVNADINTQFLQLLFDPLNAATSHMDQIIIILDALDECSDDSRRILISWITDYFPRLPPNVRFFITNRRNADVVAAPFGSKSHITELSLDVSDGQTKEDILVYIKHQFKDIRVAKRMPNDWPERHSVQNLAEYAGGLFIWAATACNFVREAYDADDTLRNLLSPDSNVANSLDVLYSVALETSGMWNDSNFATRASAVLAAIVLASVALTPESLDSILDLPRGESAKVLSQLRCVIQWAPKQPVRTLHASFADYLVTSERSGTQRWFVDPAIGHRSLALGCLQVLKTQLRFNICELESSYVLNSEVEDLDARIQKLISPELSYASQFWTTHLHGVQMAESDDPLHLAVNNCFPSCFLYWLEVLSLLGHVNTARSNLNIPRGMVRVNQISPMVSVLIIRREKVQAWGPSLTVLSISLMDLDR